MKKVILFFIIMFLISAQGCYIGQTKNLEKKEKITLTMWHIWSKKCQDNNAIIIQNAIQEWNNNNPNVQIKVESVENENYKTKIKTAFATNELPDIFYSWGGGFSEPFIESGKVLNLNEYLDNNTNNEIYGNMLSNVTYQDRIYGLPLTFSVGVLYCNTELFKDAGIEIPHSYDEFLAVVKSFREKGITPLLVGAQDKWTGMLYYNILALREGGIEGCEDALAGNDKNNINLKTALRLKELVDLKAFDESNLKLMRDESEMIFKEGKVPMYYTGNWFVGDLQDSKSPINDKVSISTFPIMKDGQGTANEFLGGAVDYLMVSNNSQYKKEAVEAIKFICKTVSDKNFEFGSGLPAWKYNYDESKINNFSKELKSITKDGRYLLYWDVYLGEEKGNKHKELVYKLLQGKISPEKFAEEMKIIEK